MFMSCLSLACAVYLAPRAAAMHVQPAVEFFERLLASQLPALAAHLARLAVPTDLYLVPWLLSLYTRALPPRTAARIWDRVLAEGEREAFKAALALLTLLQPVLLLAGFEEAVQLLQQLPFGGSHGPTGGHAVGGERLAEATLLEAMGRVAIPKLEYERLLMRCITHQALA